MINAVKAGIMLWCKLILAIFQPVWKQKLRNAFGSVQMHKLIQPSMFSLWEDVLDGYFTARIWSQQTFEKSHFSPVWRLTIWQFITCIQILEWKPSAQSVPMPPLYYFLHQKVLKSSGNSSHSPNQHLAVSSLHITLANTSSVCPIMYPWTFCSLTFGKPGQVNKPLWVCCIASSIIYPSN